MYEKCQQSPWKFAKYQGNAKFWLLWTMKICRGKLIVSSHILYYLPFKGELALHLNNLESPSPTNDLCQVWLYCLCGCLYDFKTPYLIFTFSMLHVYFPFQEKMVLYWISLKALHPMMLCAMFNWNWLSCSIRQAFENIKPYFHSFLINPL